MQINCHVHVFNLRTVLTPHSVNIIKARMERELSPPWLARALGGVVEDLLGELADASEQEVLRSFLRRLTKDGQFNQELAGQKWIPREVQGILGDTLETLELAALRRAVTGISGLLRKKGEDHGKNDVFDAFETLRIFLQGDTRKVADWLMREIPPGNACVPLMMDITNGDGSDNDRFQDQIDQTSSAAFAYPGRVLPFVFANPLRPGFMDTVRDALKNKGFIGVKLYPSLGYNVDHPDLAELYKHCLDHGVPLLTHCNDGGFVGVEDPAKFAHPDLWRPILEKHHGLKVCFAHFGGSSALAGDGFADDSWAGRILQLIKEHPGVYTDIAFHRSPMEDPEKEKLYFTRLAEYLGDPVYGGRILFGTDFWLIRPRLSEPNHWRYFETRFERQGAGLFKRIAVDNPRRFLGLPPHGTNKAVEEYAKRIPEHRDQIESPPAPWVVDLIREHVGDGAAREVEKRGEHSSPSRSLVLRGWRAVEKKIEELKNLKLDGEFDLDKPAEVDTSTRGLQLKASAALAIHLLNQRDLHDQDGILRPRKNAQSGDPSPLLTLEPDKSWLKYRLTGSLGAGAEASSGLLAFKIELGHDVVFTDYRVHPRNGLVREALLEDLRSPRFALQRADVMRLRDGEALSFAARGVIAGEVTLTWADAFGASLPGVAHALGAAGKFLAVTLDAGATVSARVEKTDDFMVVFARRGEGFRVSLRKTRSRADSVTAEVSGGLHFSDPEGVKSLIGGLVKQHVPQNLAPVRKKVEETIDEAVKKKIVIGFEYEYNRLETHSLLLEADVDGKSLEELHEELVQGDGSGLLDRVRGNVPGVSLKNYLRQHVVESRHAWGFNLAGLASKDSQSTRFVKQFDIQDNVKQSFLGSREYKGEWVREDWHWKVDFKADMKKFEKPAEVRPQSFDYGLAFLMEWERKATGNFLAEYLDAARIWGALPGGPEAELQHLLDLGLAGKQVAARLELIFDHEVIKRVLAVKDSNDEAAARAFARAMPWNDSKIHRDASNRERVYKPLWEDLLKDSRDPGWDLDDRLSTLSKEARKAMMNEAPNLAPAEQAPACWNRMWTFAGLLDKNRRLVSNWASFRKGLDLLALAVAPSQVKDQPETAQEIFDRLEDFWRQTHHVRAAGAYLLARADSLGLRDQVRSTLKIDYKVQGLSKTHVTGA